MKPVSGKRTRAILEERGWSLIRITGSHRYLVHPDFTDPVSVPIHGNRDLKPGTQRNLKRQAGLADGDL